jgi:hypothetical protein
MNDLPSYHTKAAAKRKVSLLSHHFIFHLQKKLHQRHEAPLEGTHIHTLPSSLLNIATSPDNKPYENLM